MELEQDFATIKKFLKYLPRHLKSKSLPRIEETKKPKKAKTEENLSRNELRDKLKAKILELRQKTKKKVRDTEGSGVTKKIKKEKPTKPERANRVDKAQKVVDEKVVRGRDKSKGGKPNGKSKAKSQSPRPNKKSN